MRWLTDKQTGRQTDRQADRQTDRQIEVHRLTVDRLIERLIDRHSQSHTFQVWISLDYSQGQGQMCFLIVKGSIIQIGIYCQAQRIFSYFGVPLIQWRYVIIIFYVLHAARCHKLSQAVMTSCHQSTVNGRYILCISDIYLKVYTPQ